MARDNDVFQVLVTKGNKAVLAAGLTADSLTDGQMGVFDANTNVTVDATKAPKEFYIAVGVGVDADGNGTAPDYINVSAGQRIQAKGIGAYTFRPHSPAKAQVIQITDLKPKCDTDYALKVEFNNEQIYRQQGYLQYSHVYNVRTGCCADCGDPCETVDPNQLVKAFVEKINFDDKGMLRARALNPASGNAVVTDIDAFIATNKAVNEDADTTNDVVLIIELTVKNEMAKGPTNDINGSYYKRRGTGMIVSFAEGFKCFGKITETQELAYEEGSGYDVRQREYYAAGYNGRNSTYKISESNPGFSFGNFNYFSDVNTNYDRVALEYIDDATLGSRGGWNALATEIAIPAVDTTTRNSLMLVLDAIATKVGFDALADDALDAKVDPKVAEPTSEKGKDKDGIA